MAGKRVALPDGLTIREAHEGDASRIASLHVRSKRSVYPAFMPEAYVATLDQDGHRLERWQPYFASGVPERRAWIAFVRGIPAGFVALDQPPTATAVPAGSLFLHHLHVAPEFRRRGVGTALLEAAVRHASDGRAPGIALWTQRDNQDARAFYEQAGWRADGAATDVPYQWPGGTFTVSDVRYVLALAWRRVGQPRSVEGKRNGRPTGGRGRAWRGRRPTAPWRARRPCPGTRGG